MHSQQILIAAFTKGRSCCDFTGRKYFPQPMCGGVAAIDYNNDGLMDLFFTNGAKMPEIGEDFVRLFELLASQ